METKMIQIRNFFFWTLLVYFVAVVIEVPSNHRIHLWGMLVIAVVLFALGAVLTVLTLKLKDPLMQKIFFILTGASAAAIPVCAILHNVVYGLFFAGKDGDEAVFFILAIIVCPLLFAVGMLGSIATLLFARLRKKNIAC
jgi:hypothetical protein